MHRQKSNTKKRLTICAWLFTHEYHTSDCLQIWNHVTPAAAPAAQPQQGQAAVQAIQQKQGALATGVRPGGQQGVTGVRPVGPGSAVPLQQGLQGTPQYLQTNPAVVGAAMHQHQRFPGAAVPQQHAHMQHPYGQYVQQPGSRPTYTAPLTEAQQAEQKRLHDEHLERARLETERKNRELEEKRIKAQQETQRKAQEKELQKVQAEQKRLQVKMQKEQERLRKIAEREEKKVQKAREVAEERERKRREKEEEKMRKLQEKAGAKGPRRKPGPRSMSGKGPSADGGSIIPPPDGASAPKKRAAARATGGTAHIHVLCT